MNIESFKQHFHPNWWRHLKPFLESKDFEHIWNKIKALGVKNRIVYPYSKLLKELHSNIENTIFKPFLFDFDNLEVLILSEIVPNTFTNPLNLGQILKTNDYYNAVEKSVYNGLNLNMIRNNDLSYLNEQNVMILGNSLTCEVEISHYLIWEEMIKFIIKVINETHKGLHIILLGNNKRYEKLLNKENHYIYNCSLDYDNYDMFNIINERMLKNQDKIINWALDKPPF
jgi:uracil DNA glycosylase